MLQAEVRARAKAWRCRELATEDGSVPVEHADGARAGGGEEGRQVPWAEATGRWTSGRLSTRDHFSFA